MRLVPATRNPWDQLFQIHRELERSFEPVWSFGLPALERGVVPDVRVSQDDQGYTLSLAVPGADPKDLQVEAHGNTVKLTGHWPAEDGEEAGPEFARSLQLPDDADLTRTEASCKLGVLRIHIPRKAEATPRQIPVTSG